MYVYIGRKPYCWEKIVMRRKLVVATTTANDNKNTHQKEASAAKLRINLSTYICVLWELPACSRNRRKFSCRSEGPAEQLNFHCDIPIYPNEIRKRIIIGSRSFLKKKKKRLTQKENKIYAHVAIKLSSEL